MLLEQEAVMGATARPGPIGTAERDDPIDEGTMARVRMPDPAGTTPQRRAAALPASDEELMSGGVPYAIGQASAIRIPIPGTQGLCIELGPRGRIPPGGTTSTLFFQDLSGKRHLRLDYGYNKTTRTIDFHWNQKGTFEAFGVSGHAPAGKSAKAAYHAARHFRWAGRVLMVAGAALDAVSVVQSSRPIRRASQVAAAWAGAWAGCKVAGAGGAAAGTLASPIGTAVGGIGGCIIGGALGYFGGEAIGGMVYDWAHDTIFEPIPEVAAP